MVLPILNSPLAMLSALHIRIAASFFPFGAVRCVTLPSTYFQGMSGPQLFCVKHLRESLLTSPSASPCSQTGGVPCYPRHFGQHSVVCCQHKNIDQVPLNNYFPAQSLHLSYGSAAPCPTLRADVTTSLPRTRYGRLAIPYPTGLPCCVLPAYKDCSRSQWKTAFMRCFLSSHYGSIIPYFLCFGND